ncbi:MAG: hypothetical protein ACFCD0_09105 [Gemmataceae bacterium]
MNKTQTIVLAIVLAVGVGVAITFAGQRNVPTEKGAKSQEQKVGNGKPNKQPRPITLSRGQEHRCVCGPVHTGPKGDPGWPKAQPKREPQNQKRPILATRTPEQLYTRRLELLEALNLEIPTKNFQGLRLKLPELLTVFSDFGNAAGKELPILLDTAAFKNANPDFAEVSETEVRLPRSPKKICLAAALRFALSQIEYDNAAVLIRNGQLVITTKNEASIESLLGEKPFIEFQKTPLEKACQLLEGLTGASITIDPRVEAQKDALITATFAGNVSLEAILIMTTDSVGLSMTRMGSGIYITTPENATKLEKLQKKLDTNRKKRNEPPKNDLFGGF